MAKLIIVVDAPETPSAELYDKPAWKAELFDEVGEVDLGQTAARLRADTVSLSGPAGAASLAIASYSLKMRQEKGRN